MKRPKVERGGLSRLPRGRESVPFSLSLLYLSPSFEAKLINVLGKPINRGAHGPSTGMNFINIFSLRERAREFGVAICATGSASLHSLCADLREIEVLGTSRFFSHFFFRPLYARARGIRNLIRAKCRKDILREYLKLSSRAQCAEKEKERKRVRKREGGRFPGDNGIQACVSRKFRRKPREIVS